MTPKQQTQAIEKQAQAIREIREEMVSELNELEGMNVNMTAISIDPMVEVLKNLNVVGKCMARKFVMYYVQWSEDDAAYAERIGFHDWLNKYDLVGSEDHQVAFIGFYNCAPPSADKVICRYSIMDFDDGSIAINREHERGDGYGWMVADVGRERVLA